MLPSRACTILAVLKYAGNLRAECVEVGWGVSMVPKVAVGVAVVSDGKEAETLGSVGVGGEAYSVWARTKVAAVVVS